MHIHAFTTAALLALPLLAQDDPSGRWRIGLGLGAGSLEYEDSGLSNADSASAGAFRLGFEGTSRLGFGGGLRVESYSASDLAPVGSPTTFDLSLGSLFGHFTYRVQQHRFAMPIRVGLLANAATLEAADELTAGTVGAMFEIAPEITLARSGNASWSLYGEFNLGGGSTTVELDSSGEQWDSSTTFTGAEIGTRVYLGACELSVAYVGRWQSMDQTDAGDINGFELTGYDASFNGVMFGVAVVF